MQILVNTVDSEHKGGRLIAGIIASNASIRAAITRAQMGNVQRPIAHDRGSWICAARSAFFRPIN